MADNGRKVRHLSAAERRERLAELVLRRTKLTRSEVALLREVFPELFTMYRPNVLTYLRRRRVPEADTNDASQDVFLALHRKIADEGFPESVRVRLYQLAKRVAWNYKRGDERDPVSVGLPSSGSEPVPTPPDLARAIDFQAIAPQLIERLTDQQREVVELALIDQFSHAETAEALELPIGTVKSRLAKAKSVMLELLERLLPPSQRTTT
jgi:RNA polymerase sigma factor (sigma-70 family)